MIGFYRRRAIFIVAMGLLSSMPRTVQAVDYEQREAGIIQWHNDQYMVQVRPLIVTSSAPPTGGDRIAIAGDSSTSSGVNVDGAGRLFLDVDPTPGFGVLCTGTLLPTGRHVLTAAHCVSDNSGANAIIDNQDGNVITFATSAGTFNFPFGSSDVLVHPSFDGDTFHGYDVAVIDLGFVVPASITRYQLNTDLNLEGTQHLAVGYGQSGDGGTGSLLAAGIKRTGYNDFESFGLAVQGITNPQTQLTADFDSGSAAQDGFGFFFSQSSLGYGQDEVGIGPGDSGGPSFVFDSGGTPYIAGVHTYGVRLQFMNGASSDIDTTINSSFGEFYVDARTADASVARFINSAMTVPEPSGCVLLATALLAAWAQGNRRRERGTA